MEDTYQQRMTFAFLTYAVFMSLVLIAAGFLTTTSMFHFVNFEYQKFVPELQSKIASLNAEVIDLKKEARTVITEGNKLGIQLKLRSDSSYTNSNSTASPSLVVQDEYLNASSSAAVSRKEDENTSKRKIEVRSQFNNIQSEISNRYEDIEEINRTVEKYSTESNNAYLVTRALALGALGALITGLGRNSLQSGSDSSKTNYSTRDLTISLLVGAIVSVVAIGLFYTKQITIFKSPEGGQGLPDYWRTTILCLTAGAFADRLFKAASDKVSQYVGEKQEK